MTNLRDLAIQDGGELGSQRDLPCVSTPPAGVELLEPIHCPPIYRAMERDLELEATLRHYLSQLISLCIKEQVQRG